MGCTPTPPPLEQERCCWVQDRNAPTKARCVSPKLRAAYRQPTDRQRLALGIPLNINTASPESLEQLPGIGKETALAIVKYREKHGAYRSIHAIQKVHGVGPKTVEKTQAILTTVETHCVTHTQTK